MAPAYVALSQHARKVLNNKFQQKPLGSDDFYDQDQINNVDQDFEDYNGIDGNDNSDEVLYNGFNMIRMIFKLFTSSSNNQ